MPDPAILDRLVIARTGLGALHAVGRVIAYCDGPTVTIEQSDGSRVHWRADLCEIVEMEPDAVQILMSGKTVA